MALAAQRAMLDALMGSSRNLVGDDAARRVKWSDSDVCPYYLCGYCPHSLFTNTKSDLGECSFSYHEDYLRDEFQREPPRVRAEVEDKFLRYLETIVRDMERKIARGRSRVEAVDPKEADAEAERKARIDQAKKINEHIQSLQVQVVELTAEGKPAEASSLLKLLETMEAEKQKLAPQVEEDIKASAAYNTTHDRKMVVCDVCGAYLVVGDVTERLNSHVEGKSHAGFVRVRATIEELKKKLMPETRRRSRSPPRRRSRSPPRYDSRSSRDYRDDRGRRDDRHHRDDRDRSSSSFSSSLASASSSSSSSSSSRHRSRSRERDRDRH